MVPPPTSTAMNHLLVGKNALVSGKNRPLSLPSATATSKLRPTALHSPKSRRERQGVTLHWKDAKRPKQRAGDAGGKCNCQKIIRKIIIEIKIKSFYKTKESKILK